MTKLAVLHACRGGDDCWLRFFAEAPSDVSFTSWFVMAATHETTEVENNGKLFWKGLNAPISRLTPECVAAFGAGAVDMLLERLNLFTDKMRIEALVQQNREKYEQEKQKSPANAPAPQGTPQKQ